MGSLKENNFILQTMNQGWEVFYLSNSAFCQVIRELLCTSLFSQKIVQHKNVWRLAYPNLPIFLLSFSTFYFSRRTEIGFVHATSAITLYLLSKNRCQPILKII